MKEEDYIKMLASRRGVPIIREESHKLLKEITEQLAPKRILEIGTAVGYSGIIMLEAAKDASLVTIEHDADKVSEANENFKTLGLENRVTVICDDCVSLISTFVAEGKYDKYFDMVFLDGPKAQYVKMLDSLIMLTRPGGTILADNVLFRGYVQDKTNMPRRFKTIVKRLNMFIDKVKTSSDVLDYKMYDIEDGLMQITIK